MSKPTQPVHGRRSRASRISLPAVLLGTGLIAIIALALLWSIVFSTSSPSNHKPATNTHSSESGSTAKLGKATPGALNSAAPSTAPITNSPAKSSAPSVDDAAQKAKQDELAEKQAQLEAISAQQAAREQELAKAQQQIELRKKEADAQEAINLKKQQEVAAASAAIPVKPVYHGPTSGEIVWQGKVNGSTLVTITGSTCDSGTILSGGLPGVPIIIQPKDTKSTRLAATPSPSNSYQRLVFGVSGNGIVQVVLHWSKS